MQHTPMELTERNADEIVEIEAAELELREDLVGSLSLFSCCCPCYSNNMYVDP